MPHLRSLVERHREDPFAIVGVNCGDSREDYKKGVRKHGLTWISAYQGEEDAPIAKLYQVEGFPTYYLIDSEGRVAGTGHSSSELEPRIERLIAASRQRKDGERDL